MGGILNKQIELLIEMQKLDSRIIEDTRLIEAIPLKISSSEKPMKDAEARLSSERTRHDSLEKKKREKERAVQEINEKISKLRARTSEIKTNKEYQAHIKEIESKDKEIHSVEDEILGIMVELDSVSASLKTVQKTVEEEKKKLAGVREILDAEVAAENKELGELKKKRAEVSAGIEADIYNFYMTLLERLGGLAIVEAKNEICQGCNMNIPPQLFVEIKKNEELIQCPQCKRILYHIPSAPQ